MSSDRESEVRKKRNATLRSLDEQIAEHLAESQRSGELRSAESWGRPMPEAEGWAETPTEFRLPFKILKNAGVAPPEVELFHRRAALRQRIEACADEGERQSLVLSLSELEQAIALRLEGMRASGRV